MKKIKVLSIAFSVFVFGNAFSQSDSSTDSHTITVTIPSVALVDIEPSASKNFTMAFTAPTEAGSALLAPVDNSTLWLNYSFVPTAVDKKAKITVGLSALVPGVDISVKAAVATDTASGGTLGTANSNSIVLTATAADLITNISASYTGTGANNGHNLTYSLASTTSYANLYAQSPVVTVTYTITE